MSLERAGAARPDRASAVAIVTTFHPESGLADRLTPIFGQVERVLVVDNASAGWERAEIRALADRGDVEVLWNDTNLGLATALDLGLGWASERAASWALLLDQDSRPGQGIVAEAARVVDEAGPGAVAAVGAGIIGRDSGGPADGPGWREESAVITSGTFISVNAWRSLGGFRQDFFVDYVDLEFCLRARAGGYRVLRSGRPTIGHAIGRPTRHRLLWRTVTVTHHDRERRYSMTRNRVIVWRLYGRREPRFVAADAWGFAKELLKVAAFENDRSAKVRAVFAGMRDALRGSPRQR